MNEFDEFIRKMIEYFNFVEEKLVCFFYCILYVFYYILLILNLK